MHFPQFMPLAYFNFFLKNFPLNSLPLSLQPVHTKFVVIGVLARLGEARRGEAVETLGMEVEALGVLGEAVRTEKSLCLRVLSNSSSLLKPSAKSESRK